MAVWSQGFGGDGPGWLSPADSPPVSGSALANRTYPRGPLDEDFMARARARALDGRARARHPRARGRQAPERGLPTSRRGPLSVVLDEVGNDDSAI